MELEEMKTQWEALSQQLAQQKKITDTLIINITSTRYTSRLNRVMIPEILGSLVCITGLLFIVIEYDQLNTWYLQVCGIAAVFILLILPLLSFRAIFKLRSINISQNNYRQSLLESAKGRKQFVLAQKLGFFLSTVLLLVLLPVMAQLISGKDLFVVSRLWLWYAVAFPFFYPFSQWVFKHYIKMVNDAENMLKELEG